MDGEFFYLSGGKIFISFMIQVIFSSILCCGCFKFEELAASPTFYLKIINKETRP